VSEADDYSDLGFDVEAHREALRVFADYGFSEATTRAGLKARDLVAVRMKSGKFGIGVTDDLSSIEQGQRSPVCAAFEVIHQSRNGEEVQQIRAGVERYFRRHFPGRCVDRSGEAAVPESDREKYVYIELWKPSD